jgi:hypothetical protein
MTINAGDLHAAHHDNPAHQSLHEAIFALTAPYREELKRINADICDLEQRKAIVRMVALTEIGAHAEGLSEAGLDTERLLAHLTQSRLLD